LRAENRRGTFVADTISSLDLSKETDRGTLIRRLKDSTSYRIGIADTVTDLTMVRPDPTQFEYMILHAAESRISAQGSQLLYLPPKTGPCTVLEDAIIIIAYHTAPEEVEEAVEQARTLGISPVVVSSSPREWSCPHVWTDSRVAGRQATEYLLDAGHRQIVFIAPYAYEWQERRILGARDAMRAAGLSDEKLSVVRKMLDDPIWDSANDDAGQAGSVLFMRALEEFGAIGAVIGPNDWTSVGIAQAIKTCGLEIGSEVALVSFDDTPIARQHDLSSVRFPLEQLGVEAAALALRAATGESTNHRLRIGCSLILRGSTSTGARGQAASRRAFPFLAEGETK